MTPLALIGTLAVALISASSVLGSLDSDRQEMLDQHNQLRAAHNADPLTLDAGLNTLAQSWAEHLFKNNLFMHNDDRQGTGENIASCSGMPESHFNQICPATQASQAWYDEVEIYKNQPGSLDGSKGAVGHFTQLVWKGSQKVGFGVASGLSNGMYKKITVANYSPAGNLNMESAICANVELADGAGNGCATSSVCADKNHNGYCSDGFKFACNDSRYAWFRVDCQKLCG